jgi:hypothetical protein
MKNKNLLKKFMRQYYRLSHLQAAAVIDQFSHRITIIDKDGIKEPLETTIEEITKDLEEEISAAKSGNFSSIKATLINHINILDRVFLDCLARYKTAKYAEHAKWYMDKALQAQDQSHQGTKTLMAMKPRPQNKE